MPSVVVVNQPGVTLFSGSTQVAVSGSPLRIDPVGTTQQPINTPGLVSVGNSTTSPLGSYGAFTGSWEEVTNFGGMTVTVFADRDSSNDGLSFQWSGDSINKDRTEDSRIFSGSGRAFNLASRARYFRIIYGNGATAQTTFRLSTVYHVDSPGVVTRPLSSSINSETFVQLIKSVVTGKDSGGSYNDISVTTDGRLQVASTEVPSDISSFFINSVKFSGSDSMVVDGTSPKEFTFSASMTQDTYILGLKFVLAANTIAFGSDKFFNQASLFSGVLVETRSNSVTSTLFNVKSNDDIVAFGKVDVLDLSATDVFGVELDLGGSLRLYKNTSDFIKVTIRDNVTSGAYFKMFVRGYRV